MGREINKTGVLAEEVNEFVWEISDLSNLRVQGYMTMGSESTTCTNSKASLLFFFEYSVSVFLKLRASVAKFMNSAG